MTPSPNPLRVEYPEPLDGLRLAVQDSPGNAASASITYLASAGSARDPRGEEGTAWLSLKSAVAAAGHWDRVELARRLDRLGATLTPHLSPESSEVTIWGPQEVWPELLEILSTVVLRPRFDASDVARVRRELAERQLRELSQPSLRAERELLRTIFPRGHPYREGGLGGPRSLARIDAARMRRFFSKCCVADSAVVVVTARAPRARVRRAVGLAFSELDRERRLSIPRLPRTRSVARPIRVDLPGRSQVDLRLGGPSLPRSAPEYPALALAQEILGGRPLLSRLFQKVREREGLAYHASSELEAMRWGGYWTVQAGTAPRHWHRALDLLRSELARVRDESPHPAELDLIRESAIGELPLALETTQDAHELAVESAYHELPPEFWIDWPRRLRAVRPREIPEAAALGLDVRRSVTVVAGPIGHR